MKPIKNHISLKIKNLNFFDFRLPPYGEKVLKTRFSYYHFDRKNQLFLYHSVKIGRFYVLSEAIVPRKGERIRKDSPSERKTDRPTHQKSPIEVQTHISVHTNKEK